ncbi:MAG: sigma 54-interacting transcriptional regulator [Candidatus Omnitrophica bacterium]|nr:sigma 54-interacting transcriptional regulator [Candidatus Omnitrophota bacterium]
MNSTNAPFGNIDQDAAFRAILEGTATETGQEFFKSLVQNLAKILKTQGAWVTEYLEECRRLRALAFWMEGEWVAEYEIDITGTPCETVIESQDLVHIPENLVELYPGDPDLQEVGAVSYLGVPLKDLDGKILGHLAVVDRRPLPRDERILTLFRIFASRAAAELQRLRRETEIRYRELKLSSLFHSAMDVIVELDEENRVTFLNAAGEKTFGPSGKERLGQSFLSFLSERSVQKLLDLKSQIDAQPAAERCLWIPGGLEIQIEDGESFQAEATLSRFDLGRRTYHTLILRNVNERLEAEKRIQSLTQEKDYLSEEVQNLSHYGEIIGQSKAIRHVIQDIDQVASTDATVLILGETGTGKELIARAIHKASRRKDKPLIRVNCAAIPPTLIESEFFGHEKGAFTGATRKREGRFALADGGTLFLDEIGELPIDLQVKLLRVLQEGEFEPVGSSVTRKVNVRLIAATNRDLLKLVKIGDFREDLYYRLNVFPLHLPPLRERREDIPLLAQAFARDFSGRMGRTLGALGPEILSRLSAYSWPGNVRELENVIERAIITSPNGGLNLDRALPDAEPLLQPVQSEVMTDRVLNIEEMNRLEKENLLRALERTDWKVSGPKGAAALLGMKPTTLASRLKALQITRPVAH